MLIRKPQVHIFSREVILASGEFVRAFFAVIDIEGAREIKFLGIKPLESEVAPVLLLDAPRKTVWQETPIVSVFEKLSPFFTLDFLTSQLARAPSKKA
jgi:hypothetical protein